MGLDNIKFSKGITSEQFKERSIQLSKSLKKIAPNISDINKMFSELN